MEKLVVSLDPATLKNYISIRTDYLDRMASGRACQPNILSILSCEDTGVGVQYSFNQSSDMSILIIYCIR